jgi:hypothetical protein
MLPYSTDLHDAGLSAVSALLLMKIEDIFSRIIVPQTTILVSLKATLFHSFWKKLWQKG